MEILITKKNVILDATVFTTLMSCARLTDFRFNLDLVSVNGKGNSIEAGVILHKILEVYYRSKIEGKSHDEARDIALDMARAFYEDGEDGLGFPCVPQENTTGANGHIADIGFSYIISTMEEYFEHYKQDYWIPIFAEHVKQAVIYEDDEIRIMWKAKLDLAVDTNNGIYPVDTKTMKQRRDSLSLNNQFMGQCLLMKTRGVIINKIGFQKSLKPAEKFTRPLVSYSLNRLTEWSQIIVPFWAKLLLSYDEMQFYPPNFTHCENKYGFCPFKDVCEAEPNMREQTLRLHFVKGPKWDVQNA